MRSAANPQLATLRDDLVRALEARVPAAAKRVATEADKVAPLLASVIAARQLTSRILDFELQLTSPTTGAPDPALAAERDALTATLAGLVRDLQTPA